MCGRLLTTYLLIGENHKLTASFIRSHSAGKDMTITWMENSGTEGLGLVVRLMYSHILINTSILSAVVPGFVLMAALIPQDV
jgi:hypothetical protein